MSQLYFNYIELTILQLNKLDLLSQFNIIKFNKANFI